MPPLYPPAAVLSTAPASQGYVGWTGKSSQTVQAGLIVQTAGRLELVRIQVLGTLVTNIVLHTTTTATGLTTGQCFAGLYTAAGVLMSATADQSVAWATGGLKSMALTAPQAVTYGAFYYVGFYANTATSLPTFSRMMNSSSAIGNAGLAAPNFDFATANTGLTTALPDPFTTQTGGNTAWWVALS
jgi:hypothetical protein